MHAKKERTTCLATGGQKRNLRERRCPFADPYAHISYRVHGNFNVPEEVGEVGRNHERFGRRRRAWAQHQPAAWEICRRTRASLSVLCISCPMGVIRSKRAGERGMGRPPPHAKWDRGMCAVRVRPAS